MTLQEAYDNWVKLAPLKHFVPAHSEKILDRRNPGREKYIVVLAQYDGCCCAALEKNGHMDDDRNPLPDDHKDVCARELAWRIYTRIRDGKVLH